MYIQQRYRKLSLSEQPVKCVNPAGWQGLIKKCRFEEGMFVSEVLTGFFGIVVREALAFLLN